MADRSRAARQRSSRSAVARGPKMRFLVDTQVLLWLLSDTSRVPVAVRGMLQKARSGVYFSVASLWEIAIKHSLGKLAFGASQVHSRLVSDGFLALPIEVDHLFAVESLEWHHRDPFDRILIAQSAVEPMTLLTADRRLAAYGTNVHVI